VGGRGSGHYSWRRTRRGLVEYAASIDIAFLTRTERIRLATASTGRLDVAAPLGAHRLTVQYDSDLTNLDHSFITFSFMSGGSQHHQTVMLLVTRPHLGGIRLWFVCPVTTKRTRILYLPDGRKQFASREAHNLAYRSQAESNLFRMITQAQNIRARLNGDLSIHGPFPPRPRGMHQRTYDRLRAKALTIERCALKALSNRTAGP